MVRLPRQTGRAVAGPDAGGAGQGSEPRARRSVISRAAPKLFAGDRVEHFHCMLQLHAIRAVLASVGGVVVEDKRIECGR
jgi:hypothetical protein